MAIKFGDVLENSNGKYPIIDITDNVAAGLFYVPSWNDTTNGLEAIVRSDNGAAAGNDGNGDPYAAGDTISSGPPVVTAITRWDYLIPVGKRRGGSLVLATDTGQLRCFTGDDTDAAGTDFDDTTNSSWSVVGEVPLATADIPILIDEGRSFGRYTRDDGSVTVDSVNGSSALDIILDALSGYGVPETSFTSSSTSIGFSSSARSESKTVTISIKNINASTINANNNKGKIEKIYVYRRYFNSSITAANINTATHLYKSSESGDGTYDATLGSLKGTLNTQTTSPTAQTYTLSETLALTANNANDYAYGVEVYYYSEAGTAVGTPIEAVSEQLAVGGYSPPTVDLIVSNPSHSVDGGSALVRERGNYGSSGTIQVTKVTSLTTVDEIRVYRNFDGSQTLVKTITPSDTSGQAYDSTATAWSDSFTTTTDVSSFSYYAEVDTSYTNTTNLDTQTINLYYPVFIGDVAFASGPTGSTTLNATQITSLKASSSANSPNSFRIRRLVTSTLPGGIPNFDVDFTVNNGYYLVITYPSTTDLTNFSQPSAANELTSLLQLNDQTIEGNHGKDATYSVYVSGSPSWTQATYSIS